MSPVNAKLIKTACYIRVSTQEQKLHGLSLSAQRDRLAKYAEEHDLLIVEWYEDAGVSGRKLIKRRPQLQRLLKDAQEGKFDRIIFIKLDRYFRSVAEYHECQKILDTHNVTWTATEERYDLTTASGRYWVNQKLAMAEYEADNTGERIRLVNEYKIATGQPLTGSQRQGLGYCVGRNAETGLKNVIKDPETQEMCEEIIKYFITYQNKQHTILHIKDKYNVVITMQSLDHFLRDTKIYGHYRGNNSYCPAYIDKNTYDYIQEILDKNIKATPSKQTYIFSGLIRCPKCDRLMSGTRNSNANPTFSYRCNNYVMYKVCKYNKRINENKVEKHLLEMFNLYVTSYVETSKIEDARVKDSHATDKIKEVEGEMERLTKAYRKGRVKEEEYDRDYDELESKLNELKQHLEPILERDLTKYEELLKSNWKELYNALNKENRRAFWRKYIKQIIVNDDGTVSRVIFF